MSVSPNGQIPALDLLAEPRPGDHFLRLYDHDDELIDALRLFVAHGIGRGESVVLVISRPHRVELERTLIEQGFPIRELLEISRVIVVEAEGVLPRLLRDGLPDAARFRSFLVNALVDAESGVPGRRIRIFGELVDLLWRSGNLEAAIALEALWNEALLDRRFSLFCAYGLPEPDARATPFPPAICAAHGHVFDPTARHRPN